MITFPKDWLCRKLRIALIGCGGTGSEMMARLYKMNFLLQQLGNEGFRVDAYDPKCVSEFNVGRQNFWVHDIGLPKAEVLVSRYNHFGGCEWCFVNSVFKVNYATRYDIIISCVDSATFRAKLGKVGVKFASNNALWLDGGNDNRRGQAVIGHLSRKPDRTPNVFDLFPELATTEDDNRQSCSHADSIGRQDFGINANVAEAMSQKLWKLLRYGKVDHNIAMIDLKTYDITSIPATPEQWALFGYTPEEVAPPAHDSE